MPRPPLLAIVAIALLGLLAPALASSGGQPTLVTALKAGATHGDRIPAGADDALRRTLRDIRRSRRGKARAASAANGLADGLWCGAEQATDDTAYQAHTGAREKVIYAYPSDGPNRFTTMRDLIQADARDMTDILLSASGGAKTLRFDVGTRCGAGYLDILSVRLPRTAAQYKQLDANSRMAALKVDLASSVAGMAGKSNYLVYADHSYANDGVAGIGSVYMDDRPGSNNAANSGTLWAIAFGDSGDPDFLDDRLTTVLHEVSHNLGAVQDSAPHSTQAGHCFDEQDVMCYDDGGPTSTLTYPCAQQAYDCGQDDYFNAAPAAGSYLATHWNVYRSTFLCPAGSCSGQDVGGGNPKPVAQIGAVGSVTAGLSFRLEGGGSSDDEAVAEYAWDIGADGTIESRDVAFTTALASPGTYPVRLTVRDAYGAVGTADAAIVVATATAPPVKQAPAATPSRRAVAALALKSSLLGLRTALRTGLAASRLKLPFSAPQAGRLEAKVSIGGRDIATGKRSVRAGRSEQLTVSLSKTARRRLSRGGKVTVRLTFRTAAGTAIVERRSVTLPRRA